MSPEETNKKQKKTALQQWLKRKKSQKVATGIVTKPEESPAVLSHGQQRLWFLQQLHPGNPFYHYAHRYRFRGALQLDALQKSWQQVISRHPILQTQFLEIDGRVIQKVNTDLAIPITVVDLSDLPKEACATATEEQMQADAKAPFDLENGPLLKLKIFRWSEEEYCVSLTMHHIIGDRWSLGILNREWATAYRTLVAKEASELERLPIQYLDYAHWQRQQKTKSTDLNYWQDRLAGELPLLNLPTDFSRPAQTQFRGKMLHKTYSTDLSKQLKSFCKQHNCTMFVVLLSAFKVLLQRYTGQDDLLVGTPFSNRDQTVLEKLIGFFNETLVLRSDLSDDPTFLRVVEQVQKNTIDAFSHKNVPFEDLVRTLKVDRSKGANPLFQVMFLYDTVLPTPSFGESLLVEESSIDLGVSKFDLTLFIVDHGEQIEAVFEYATDLFELESVERMHGHLEQLLQQILQKPTEKISNYSLLTPAEQNQLIEAWNEHDVPLPETNAIHHFFEKHAAENPSELAVVYESDQLTYQQLNEQANALAHTLQKNGVQKNQPVGIYCKRSVELMVAILGVLKSGGAYLPLDPDYPSDRIDYMLTDAQANLVLTQTNLVADLAETTAKVITISEAVAQSTTEKNKELPLVDRDHLAYIIYTSGSTGKPKGVPIQHGNLIHSTAARFHFYQQQPGRFLLLSSFSFDSSVAGIFWSLCAGGTLVLPKKRIEQDLEALATLVAKHQVTHTLLLPSLYSVLLEHAPIEKLQSLNTIMVAGEACSAALVKRHFKTLPNVDLYNEYGPTEGTVWCTAHKIEASDAERSIPIGRPIPYVENYILDAKYQAVPIGVIGELYVGGAGLTQGYLHRPELTKEKLIPHPFIKKEDVFLYKTGDLARYRLNGVIDFLGRADHQVKIRGFRIELDEIKEVLLRNASIRDAVVMVDQVSNAAGETLNKRLLAFVIEQEKIDQQKLLAELKQQLPAYMVPSNIVPLTDFPRLPNGKVNIPALPIPDASQATTQNNYVAARSTVEQQLVTIWEEVLQRQPIGIHDNFFDIGGDSILSIQIIAKARKAALPIAPNQLYNEQTIAALSATIEANENPKNAVTKITIPEAKTYPLNYMQEAFLMHHLRDADDEGFLQLVFTLRGTLDRSLLQKAWQHAVDRHIAMRSSIHWQDRTQPEQLIHEQAELPWTFYDWRNQSGEEQLQALEQFKKEDRNKSLDWSKAPISRMALMQLAEDKYELFWTCHHILLDGWSGGIVLKDALTFYHAERLGQAAQLDELPSYAAYLQWLDEQDLDIAASFWRNYLVGFSQPNLWPKQSVNSAVKTPSFVDHTFTIDASLSRDLQQFVREKRVALPTLLQGLWGILLAKHFNRTDVVFGTTVSGRFVDFPGIEQMTGLFMNVLPTRIDFDPKMNWIDWLKKMQEQQASVRQFEQITMDQINDWIDWPNHLDLFDSLFVYGNFLKDGLTVGEIEIEDFSGGFTSSYPLTIRVNPLEVMEFDLRYDVQYLSEETIKWFEENLLLLLQNTVENALPIVEQALEFISAPIANVTPIDQGVGVGIDDNREATYQAPRNEVELQLSKVWETVLGRNPIGVTDHFFEIGGHSLLAIQLFSKIEKVFGRQLPAVVLFEHPTIEALAKLISGETATTDWSSLVPLRAGGSKAPLFCFHSGGGHVFFYKALAQHFNADRPIYAVQPKGIAGEKVYHDSIEAMAKDYIVEMQRIQAKGPYHLLGTCFSNAVGLEVANQLHSMGEEVDTLFIIDSGPTHLIPLSPNGKPQPVRRFTEMLKRGDWQTISKKLKGRWKRLQKRYQPEPEGAEDKALASLVAALNGMYRNYRWQKFRGEITFIRSEEFAGRKDKKYHLEQWSKLAGDGLDVHVIPGHHKTLFEEPEVQGLAKQLSDCMEQKE